LTPTELIAYACNSAKTGTRLVITGSLVLIHTSPFNDNETIEHSRCATFLLSLPYLVICVCKPCVLLSAISSDKTGGSLIHNYHTL